MNEEQTFIFEGSRDVVSLHGFISPNFEVGNTRIMWVKSGTGEYRFGDVVQPVTVDDVILLSPGERSITFDRDQSVHLRGLTFSAPDGFMDESHLLFPSRDRRHRLLIEIIDDIFHNPGERTETMLRIIAELFEEVEAERQTTQNSVAANQPEPLLEVVRQIDENPHLNYSISELAKDCDYSESHFRRLFRSVLGISPKQYIKKAKMNYALYLLKEEKLTVKDVAATLGYNDTFEFSKQFKTVFGSAPSKLVS